MPEEEPILGYEERLCSLGYEALKQMDRWDGSSAFATENKNNISFVIIFTENMIELSATYCFHCHTATTVAINNNVFVIVM